tara:strand:+ start:10984 stop:11475 length:492 start_codon:yes stop_codon:yes gene_type:complete
MHPELTTPQVQTVEKPAPSRSRIPELLQITSRLIKVLEDEIGLLRSMKPTDVQDLQQEKIVLAAAYQAAMEDLHNNPTWLTQLPPQQRRELRQISEQFQKVLNENARALRAARDVTEGLLQHIMQEVKSNNSNPTAYSAQGKMMTGSYAGASVPKPVTLDRSL